MELKAFQHAALDTLTIYLQRARLTSNPEQAFLQLSRWLDKECRQADVTQPVLLEFCRKIIADLTTTRGLALNDLLRFKYQLAKAVQQKIAAYRQQAYAQSYQTFLLAPQAQVATSFADGFAFDNRPYPAAWSYSGAYQFKKHFFGGVGELASTGEEFECAKLLDTLPAVTVWTRPRRARGGRSRSGSRSGRLWYIGGIQEMLTAANQLSAAAQGMTNPLVNALPNVGKQPMTMPTLTSPTTETA